MVGRKLFRRVKGSVDERRFRLGYRINRKCIREGGGEGKGSSHFRALIFFPPRGMWVDLWINFIRRNNEAKFKERRKGPCIK